MLLKTEAFIVIHPNEENATCQGITDKLQQPDKRVGQSVRVQQSVWRSRSVDAACGSRGAESPCDEGQASLGEALETVHTCRLCLSLTAQSPAGTHRPRAGTIHGAHIRQCFFNIIHNIVIAKDFALQLYYVHLYSEKNTVNR